jgi:pimeloyl-ACP methyl ester carboxylesterase
VKKYGIILLTFVLLIVLADSCMQFRTSSKGINKAFESTGITPNIKDIDFKGKNFRYLEVSDGSYKKPTVIFIHGAPGSSDNYVQFMVDKGMVNAFDMVSVDRLGYGYSEFGHAETSLTEQANSLFTILQEYKETPTLLVGHSFGGPIAVKAAVLYPNLVEGLMLLAPAIDPENEKIMSIAWMGKTPPFSWITPRSIKVATDEKFSHIEELERMLPDWGSIQIPVTYIQGDKDRLVPYANLAFANRMIKAACLEVISLKDEDHFLPWTQEELIKEELHKLTIKASAPCHE